MPIFAVTRAEDRIGLAVPSAAIFRGPALPCGASSSVKVDFRLRVFILFAVVGATSVGVGLFSEARRGEGSRCRVGSRDIVQAGHRADPQQ